MSTPHGDRETKDRVPKEHAASPRKSEDELLDHGAESAGALSRTLDGPTAVTTAGDIVALQRSVGNRAVQRLLAARDESPNIRPSAGSNAGSLHVSVPHDPAELEADRL